MECGNQESALPPAAITPVKPAFPQIALGYIRGHGVAGRFMECLVDTLLYDAETWNIIRGRIIPVFCAHYLHVGRNKLTRGFLRLVSAEVLISLDTDQTFTPQDVMRLAALCTREQPVVSGLYHACDQLDQVRPIVLKRDESGALQTCWEFPESALVEVDVVGMGFCAIHRSLLEAMQADMGEHWFSADGPGEHGVTPEDNAFCRRVRARGVPIVVHTGIDIGHLKTVELKAKDRRRTINHQAH